MKKAGVLLVLAVIAVVMMLVPVAWGADVQGKMVTLDDGTKLMIPPTIAVEKKALQSGANVKASYEEKDGQKVATSFMVMPPR